MVPSTIPNIAPEERAAGDEGYVDAGILVLEVPLVCEALTEVDMSIPRRQWSTMTFD